LAILYHLFKFIDHVVIFADLKDKQIFSGYILCLYTLNFHVYILVCFSPNGHRLLTSSSDRTARLWSMDGTCLQQLREHTDDIFACAFSYMGDSIITSSKDNTCTIWRWFDWFRAFSCYLSRCLLFTLYIFTLSKSSGARTAYSFLISRRRAYIVSMFY